MPNSSPLPRWISPLNLGIVLTSLVTVLLAAMFQYRVVMGYEAEIRFFVVPALVGVFFGVLLVAMRRIVVANRLIGEALAERNSRIESLNRDLEDRVAERTKELLQAQRSEMVGQLVGGVAHDLNNLLTVIRCNVDVLKLGDVENPLLTDVIDATERGERLTNRLLATLRRAHSAAELPVDQLVDELVGLLKRAFGPKFTIDVQHGKMPAPRVEAGRLEQILLNLLVNARDAQPNGGRIIVRTVGSTFDKVAVEVEDEGPGVPPELQDKIFDTFFTTKSEEKGSGLGLSTVRLLVNEANGQISLNSSPRGACFRVELPGVKSPTTKSA